MKGPIMLLLALVAGVLAGPINVRYNEPNVCSTTCTESSKFKYEPGTTYVFDYNVQTETSMEGASADKAVMGIKATAHVEVMSKCDMALRLSDVRLYPKSDSQFTNSLEDQALRFSFQDGRIEDLCPVDGEPHWVLNIKRGILSTFQNSMDNLELDQTTHETDVTGKCPAEYKLISKGWYTKAIKKTKNLLGCMDRHGWRSAVQASPYRIPSELQSLPLMKSEHECDQEIENRGYVKSTVCKETHVFRPFSHYNNGSSTKVLQKLTFNRQIKQTTLRPNTVNTRTTMLFTHSEDHPSIGQNQRLVEAKLADLCTKSKVDIRPEVPEIFAEMIFLMRSLDATALRDIYRQAERGSICRDNIEKTKKFFLDAIPMVSTSSSVQLLKELLISKAVTGTEADMWLTSLALIQSPTREMISEVKAILNMKDLEETAMLPITSLVNNYCSKNTKCSEEYEVTGIISTLERNLGYGCYVRDENLEKVLLTLRAIGNAGHSATVGSSVSNCFTRQSNPAEVRVTALDAFRRLPCSIDRSEPLSILRDTDEDSEIRIAAYLAIMKCPSDDLIKDVRTILEAEEANQVSSFIWSHLTNLMETSSPHKQSIRDIVQDQRLKKSFDLERIKYSRNYEGSFMLESLNTGAVAESNVIWSSKSFIPRSAMVNLTVDLFGSSVNLFELGGRVEGLEYLIETYLGPFGYFGEKSSKDSIAKSREQLDKLRASMYMRMFGNEMSFSHFKGIKAFNSEKFNYLDFLIKISKEHDYSYSQSMMFLDSSVIIPTTSGLPLNLTVTGVSSMDLKASGSVDLRKVAASPRSLNIDGTIKPSGAVTITGAMSVDAYVTKTGLKMTSTLHSSTAVTGRIRLERGKILEVVFEMPQKKMEVLDVKSRFFTINGEEEREQVMITENRKEKIFCTGSKLAEIVGLELCGEVKFPNASHQDAAPYFPFTGPTSMSVVLHKRDTHAGYKLLAKRTETKEQSIAQIAFDTPGSSRVKRAIAMDVVLNFPNKHLEVSTTSPWTAMMLKGKVINEETNKAFIGSFEKDGARYSVNAIVDVENKGPMTKLSPRIEIIRPRSPKIILAGSMDIEGTKRFATDLSLVGAINHPISVKGSIVDTKMEKSFDGRLQFDKSGEYIIVTKLLKESRKTSMKIAPTFEIRTPTEHVTMIDGNMDYRQGRYLKGDITATIKKLLPKPIEIKFKNIMKEDKRKNMRYDLDVFVASKWLSGKIDGNMVRSSKAGQTTTVRLAVDYKLPKGKKNKFIVSGKLNDKCTKSIYKYILNANMDVKKNPEYNWVVNLDMSHNNKHSDASAIIKYGKNLKDKSKQIELSSTLNRKGSLGAASIDYKISSKIPVLDVDVSANGDHKHDRKYLQNNMVLNYGKGKLVKTAVKLYDRSKKSINMGGEIDLKYPEHQLNINTDFDQNKNQYVHKLNFKMDKKKSSITTTYNNPKSKKHEVSSEIFLNSFQPITLVGTVNLDLDKFKSSGKLIHGDKKYGFIASKTSRDMYNHVMDADVYYPGREISTDIRTGASNNKYTGAISTNWDKKDKTSRVLLDVSMILKSLADMDGSMKLVYPDKTITINAKHQGKDKVMTHVDVAWSLSEKIDLDFTHSHTNNYRTRNIGTSLVITTPFRMVPKITTELTYNNDYNGIKTTSLVSWGRDQITSNASIKKPISASRFEAEASVTTPFTGFRRMSSDINHRISERVYTTLKGSLEDKTADVIIKAGLKGDPRKEIGMDASLTLKSNILNMESMSAQISHVHDLQKFTTDFVLDHNGAQYIYDLDMSVNNGQWKFETDGKLMLVSPYYRVTTNWKHLYTDGSIKSTLNSDWGRGRKFYIDLSGNHENLLTRKIDGSLAIETPWEALPEAELNLKHEFGKGVWNYMGNLKSERQIVGSSSFNYRRGTELVTFDVKATTPYSEDLTGALSVSTKMPYTGRIEAEWARDRKITIDGSVNGQFPSNIEGTIRFTTPFKALSSVVATASNKKDGGEWITSSTVEYGVRKSIQLETRLGLSDYKKVRVQLLTPYDILRKLDSGIEFNAGKYEVNGQADFEVVPVIGKFSSSINANWENDMSARARLETPFREFQYAQFDASSSKGSKGRQSKLEIEYSPRQIITLDNHYNFKGPIIFDINMKTPFTNLEEVGTNIRHSINSNGFKTDAEIKYAPYKTISGDLRMNMKRNGIEGNLKVTTPFRGYKTSNARFSHSGLWTDFNTYGSIEAHSQKYDADIRFQHGESTSTSITVHTPFYQYEETKYTMEKKGGLYNLDLTTSFVFGREQIDLALGNKASRGVLKTDFTVMTPYTEPFKFNIDHYGLLTNFQTKVSSSFGRDNMIDSTTKVTIRLPKIEISSDADYLLLGEGRKVGVKINKEGELMDMSGKIEATCDTHKASLVGNFKFLDKVMGGLVFTTSSFRNKEISMSFSHEGPLQSFQSEGNVKYLDNEMSGKLGWYNDGLRHINSAAEISTPFAGFEQMGYDYQHSLVERSFTANGKVSYGYNKDIIGDVAFSMEPVVTGSVTLKTPFEDYRNNRIAFKGEGSMTDFKIHGEGELFGERLDISSNLFHDSMYKTEGLFNMKASSRNIRDVIVNFSNIGRIGTFAATGAVNYAGEKIMEGKITSVHQPSKTAYTLNLQCMFMNSVDASFEHTGTPISDCHTKLSASVGDLISGTYNSDMTINGNNADIHLEGTYKYYEMNNKASLNLKKEGEWSNGKMSADAKISDKDVSASATYNIRRNNVNVETIVNTPFDGFRDLAANLDYANRRQRVVKASVRYMDGQEVTSEMKLLNDGWKDVTASATVDTPFQGYERTTVKYNHALDDTSLKSGITAKYGRNMEISTTLAIESDEENLFELEVSTPFIGYRDTKFSAKMNKNRSTPSAAVTLTNGRSTVYGLQGEMDLSSTPMNGGLHITTPYNQYRKADITFTHSGEWSDFRSTANVNSELTGPMEGDVSFVYNSPKSLDTSVTFKSEFANFEDLSFSAKSTPNSDGVDSTIVAEWAPMKKIEYDSSYNRHKGWSSVEHVGSMSLSTPFEALKSAMVKMSVEQAGDKYTKKITISHNDDELVDITGIANLGDNKDITVDIESPRPMQIVVSLQKDHAHNGEVFVNWNKREQNSQVRLQGSVTPNGGRFDNDKDFEIKLIHPVRTMGLSGTLQSSDRVLKSKGALLWNENKGQRFAYDLDMSSLNRRRKQIMDSSLKIELPTRTLEFTGVVNKNSYEQSIDGSVMWDAAEDKSKKVGVKATFTPGSKTNKMEVILNLPTIQRDIRIGSEMTLDNGKVIFDGKTEFSYSPDSRKTLVLTSNLKDVSYDRSLKNYTMSLGIRHLYTNTDLFLTSHLGQSTDKLSTGMSMQYLTASRQRMNMMLLGEIDQLRRRINVDVISPMKRVKVVGEVDSIKPFHASIQNEIDDAPGMSAELAVDCEKKTFDFQAKYDPSDLSNTLYIEGRYPNRSAIRAEVYTIKQGRRISESIMGIRLNTSRIIHTKVTWRPEISQEIQALAGKGYRSMMREMMVMDKKISEELTTKYSKIADATVEELMPFIAMIDRELTDLGKDMETVATEMRRMYGRNDLFIRDMGEYVQGKYLEAHVSFRRLIEQYKTMAAIMVQDLTTMVQTIKHYPITEEYYKFINTIKMYRVAQMEKMSAYLDTVIADLKGKTQMYTDKYSQHILELKSKIANHHSVQALKRKISELQQMDYSRYIADFTNTVGEQFGKLNLPEKYNAAITNVHSIINDNLDSIMRRQEMKYLHSAGNEVYQQGKWAYGYWGVEENVKNQIHQIVELVKKMIKEEYTKFQQIMAGPRVNVTVYDPVRGEFQADVYLILPLETLDELPRVTNYIDEATNVMTNYLPSKDTVVQMYNNYFPESNTTDPEFKQELNEYITSKPKRRMRNLNRRKNVRNARN